MSDWTPAQQAEWEAEYRLRFPNIPRGFTMYGLHSETERNHLRTNVHDSGAWTLTIHDARGSYVGLTWDAARGVQLRVELSDDEIPCNGSEAIAIRRAFINIDEVTSGQEVTRWG